MFILLIVLSIFLFYIGKVLDDKSDVGGLLSVLGYYTSATLSLIFGIILLIKLIIN